MTDPYAVLGVPVTSDDEAIRKRYLELIREFPPEHHAQKFSEVRAAYEVLRDLHSRVAYRLLEDGKHESFDAIIEEVTCRTPRRRYSLQALIDLSQANR